MPISIADGTTVGIEVKFMVGNVSPTPGQSLKINVPGFRYDLGGACGDFDGAVAQAVPDDDTAHVYLNQYGALTVSTDVPTANHICLARVVAANGEIVAIHDDRILLTSSSSVLGLCVISLPVDGDIRGGDTSASANNNWAAVKFEQNTTGQARIRIVRRTPQNYESGSFTIRLACSISTSVGASQKSRWEIEYKFASLGESLGTLAIIGSTIDHAGQTYDELFEIELVIPEENVDMSKGYMAFQINRDNDHVDDDLTQDIYVHNIEFCYWGHLLAGQAGQ